MAREALTIYFDPQSLAIVNAQLARLSDIERDAVVQKGLSDGAGIIRRETNKNMHRLVKRRNGYLYSSLSKKKVGKLKKGDVRYQIGFKRTAGAAAHLIDKGTTVRYTKGKNGKKKAYRGKVTPRLFHTMSVEKKGEQALNVVAESIKISIDRIMSRNQ